MAKRSDNHAPSTYNPAEYTFLQALQLVPTTADIEAGLYQAVVKQAQCAIQLAEDAGFRGNFAEKRSCDHCGAYFNYGALYQHTDGEIIVVGNVCAASAFGPDADRDAQFKRAQKAAATRREHARNAAKVGAEHPGIIETLQRCQSAHRILADMLGNARRWGKLSDKQVAFAWKLASEAYRPKWQREEAPKVPVTAGKRHIEGTVVSVKYVETMYGGAMKMLVITDEGEKIWGTRPASLCESKPGARVTFTATVEVSRDDECFGFFKRPSKARELAAAA